LKAIVCDQFGDPSEVVNVRQIDHPAPPKDNEVTVQVAYATVSHAIDLLIRGKYQSDPPLPFTPGTEFVGTVLACGQHVQHLKVGDRVMGVARWGCYAQHINVSHNTVYPILPALDWLEALPLTLSYGTAYTALFWKAGLQASQSVLVLGAGSGVGLAAVELASATGATVIACASTEEKRALAAAHGAQLVLAPNEALVKNIKAFVRGGVDLIVDPVGAELMETSLSATAHGAQILSIGFAAGRPPRLPQNIMLVKNLSLHGFYFGRYIGWTPNDERLLHEPHMRRMMDTLQRLTLEKKIFPTTSNVYEMEALPQALIDLHSRQVLHKLAIKISGDKS
jgi:NADPH2:quinone reductase